MFFLAIKNNSLEKFYMFVVGEILMILKALTLKAKLIIVNNKKIEAFDQVEPEPWR